MAESPARTATTTGAAGFALQNATPTILSLTTPAVGPTPTGKFFVNVTLDLTVTGAETGGALQVNYTNFGTALTLALDPGARAASFLKGVQARVLADAGSTVTLVQLTALTAGAATAVATMSVQG
jgi:hypothetical protein